jgi:hypothetical protein
MEAMSHRPGKLESCKETAAARQRLTEKAIDFLVWASRPVSKTGRPSRLRAKNASQGYDPGSGVQMPLAIGCSGSTVQRRAFRTEIMREL